MKVQLQVITNSELGTWRDCRARHGYRYVDRLRPMVDAWPLRIGTILHAGLEAGVAAAWNVEVGRVLAAISAATATITAALKEWQSELEQLRDGDVVDMHEYERLVGLTAEASTLGNWMLLHYFEATAADLEDLVPLGLEEQFRVPVPDAAGRSRHLFLTGKIDGVFLDLRTLRIVVRDYKTTTDNPDSFEAKLAIDTQMTGYLHAVRDLLRRGALERADGQLLPALADDAVGQVQYDVLRRKAPTVPKVNKIKKADGFCLELLKDWKGREEQEGRNYGLVSVDKRIDTRVDFYRDAIVEQEQRGLPRTQAQDALLEALTAKGDTFFRRFEYWRDPEETERWRKELWIEGRQMREAARAPSLRLRNPGYCTGFMAKRCEYQSVCRHDTPEARGAFRIADTAHEELR